MLVSELLFALRDVSPDAEVLIWAKRQDPADPKQIDASGELIYVAITSIDGDDKIVVLSNCVVDKRGTPVFDAPPQLKRFCVSTGDGPAAAEADLAEQAGSEPTLDLRQQMETERMKNIFRNFEDLLNGA